MKKSNFSKTFKTSLFGLLLSSLSMGIFADATEDLELKLSNIKSLKADFSQTVLDDLGLLMDESKGVFELDRPQKFRWLVREPYEQDIVADGMNLWQFDRDIEQINVAPLSDTFANSPAALLSKTNKELALKYIVTSHKGQADGVVIYRLEPRDEDALFEMMLMEFNQQQLVALQVKDNLGQTTMVELNNAEFNLEFAEDNFSFNAPDGVDVIDTRQ